MKTRYLVLTALISALLCIVGPLTIPIPISPVPITLLNFVLCLSLYLIEWKQALLAVFIYLLLGLVGLPVFSSFQGGFSVLAGPTGGYLIGYLFFVLVSGLLISKYPQKKVQCAVGFIIGLAALYAFGSIWMSLQMNISFAKCLVIGVIPYLPGDIIKILLAVFLGPVFRARLVKISGTTRDNN